ncbi:hypothetical protein [Pseudomonas lactis]|uniref:hypothetical protein n=1 Tax=Pseudomonas lactis TaxID=1615674 RepID=UPI00110C85BF|nr:hypothetical protein [Pseudomonas lactis]
MQKDYLGPAAEAKRAGKAAVKAGRHDDAWGHFHDQKSLYMQHANRSGFTPSQVLALDSTVHVDLANILRLEKRDHEALAHILYVVIAQGARASKQDEQKLVTYFKRCKLQNTDVADVKRFASSKIACPDFLSAQSKAKEWITRG